MYPFPHYFCGAKAHNCRVLGSHAGSSTQARARTISGAHFAIMRLESFIEAYLDGHLC